ncbi:MAG: hypothetical protein H5T86_15700, partial [Armatimonadetes bacterium]|nr:hypothetical protein [Armatimonadota bacterium]
MTQPLKFRQVTPLTVSDTALVFELPDLGGPGVYLVSLETAEGAQKREVAQVLLNAAEVWSVVSDDGLYELQPNNGGTRERRLLVQRGAKLTVFGRCLKIGDRQPRAMLVSGDASGASSAVTALEVEAATPFCLHLRVPENAPLTRGAPAALVVTNGYGDESAASRLAGVAVRVLPKLPLPAQVYEPVSGAAPAERGTADWEKPAATVDATDFGADGYDAADDGEAIQEALDAAAKTQGTAVVKLPPGRLFVREPLRIPPHTLLQGAGREMTAICIPDTDEPPEAWLVGQHHFSIQDLTVYCSNHKHIITGDMSGDADKAGHVLLRRVRVRGDAFRGHLKPEDIDARLRAMLKLSTGGGDTVRFSGPDVIVEDCDLYGSGRSIYFYNVRGGVVRNSRLYNGRWGWYNFNVCRDVVIEGNLLAGADLMSTGGSYACYGPETCSEIIY